jgi:hypothetical protein
MLVKAGRFARKSESYLEAFERKVLRTILSPMKENNTWRIIYNNELYKQSEEPSMQNIRELKNCSGQVTSSVLMENTEKDSGKQQY